ncbi:phosphatidate cytidylyltransferase [Bacillus testis]|uniref:phosphatidate cytidylyltransferase n=1 Tax=Bacillus testis TaxID=1622072 RepID=UPI00067EE63A|nr:phosphatidate cytidylyltransferase [Bacillus testis]
MKQRIITAVIAAAIFLPVVIYGGWPFTILIYLMATVGLHELLKMHKMPIASAQSILAFILLWLTLIPEAQMEFFTDHDISKMTFVLIGLILLLAVTVLSKNAFTFDDAGFMLIAVLYTSMGFYYIMATREIGLVHIFFVLFTLWATDSGAYFVGRAIGKNKLWPEISPNKTIEGALGGVIAGLIVALVFALFTDIDIPVARMLVLGLVIAVFGQLGDLVQSAFKRHYGVKDSGNLLPGHGGILDRSDSWLFVFPILYLLQLW